VRQSEYLRRAFTRAAGAFRWESIPGGNADRVAVAAKDATELADVGAQLLDQDLADLLTAKRGEIQQIKKVAKSIHNIATNPGTTYPAEVTYSHTMKSAVGGLVTKTVVLNLNDSAAALSAATALEGRMEALAKLRDLMLEDLRDRQRQVKLMRKGLPDFVESSNGVLVELLGASH
jgi:hypothetical protein